MREQNKIKIRLCGISSPHAGIEVKKKMWSNRKGFFVFGLFFYFLIDHIVCLFELPLVGS